MAEWSNSLHRILEDIGFSILDAQIRFVYNAVLPERKKANGYVL